MAPLSQLDMSVLITAIMIEILREAEKMLNQGGVSA